MKLVNSADPILKQTAIEWDFDSDQDPKLLENEMIDLMTTNYGRGLAANQIGLLKRVFVIKLDNHNELANPLAMFNPKVTSVSDEVDSYEEGCLSFPGLFLYLKRPNKIDVEFFTSDGKMCTITLTGIDARCFLHELDHLNGICFVDKVSKLKLSLAKKKQRKYNG